MHSCSVNLTRLIALQVQSGLMNPSPVQVGVQKARRIAAEHGLKYIPVHHMEAHALIARAGTAVSFPYLCLLVSGGHNMIVIVEGVGAYILLGSTLDDAVGERASNSHSSFLISSALTILSRTYYCCLRVASNVSHASVPP